VFQIILRFLSCIKKCFKKSIFLENYKRNLKMGNIMWTITTSKEYGNFEKLPKIFQNINVLEKWAYHFFKTSKFKVCSDKFS